jgi:hypothetical protein
MVVKNPKKVFPSFKTACLAKAKEIRDFINKHSSVGLNPRKVLQFENLQEALRDQFKRMERDNLKGDIENDIVFDEVEEIVNTSKGAVNTALLESEEFLEERSVQVSDTGASPAGTTSPPVKAVQAVKLPAFLTEESEFWFAQAEAHFRTRNRVPVQTNFPATDYA